MTWLSVVSVAYQLSPAVTESLLSSQTNITDELFRYPWKGVTDVLRTLTVTTLPNMLAAPSVITTTNLEIVRPFMLPPLVSNPTFGNFGLLTILYIRLEVNKI